MRLSLATTALALAAAPLSASIITDASLVFGADAIDGPGFEAADQEIGASQASLEALSTFGAVQDFGGFAPLAGSNTANYLSFTDPNRSDVRVTVLSGDTSESDGGGTNVANTLSSAGSSISFKENPGGAVTLRFDFGSYDAGADTFDASVGAVDGVGFMFNNIVSGPNGSRVQATFFSDSAAPLFATAVLDGTGAGSGNRDYSIGYLNTGLGQVGYFDVTFTTPGANNRGSGLDDLGFTAVIPEPTSAMAIAAGGLCLLGRRRRA